MHWVILGLLSGLYSGGVNSRPLVAVIIDDLGYHQASGRAAVELPGPYAYAVLPHAPHAASLANLIDGYAKEVLLHLPMEAAADNHLLGAGAIYLDMDEAEIRTVIAAALAAVPHVIGVSNHMGSRLTTDLGHMRWVMRAIHDNPGLFFVDSRTTARSVAAIAAAESGVTFLARDKFLDSVQAQAAIREQLRALVEHARKYGRALGIAHPYPETMKVLRRWRPEEEDVCFVDLRTYIASNQAVVDAGRSSARPFVAKCGGHRNEAGTTQQPDAER